ncbi:TetR/AcrR family transcriptional regulator [Flavivirga aquimarina]|uniref:TetR/AcrR family transcriptional regulator n=1 Tax=Flavivirga aquimarina TaxID=2027862 RepID=A0ABT8WB44_9FLAO|nr:TetR/AcrR family transcriptional regulator [Flavivirga aquimarina]MDO5970271.1 TetR/AcrR family transcriptional regulator [Flavivirga aquimarina]
MPKETFLKLNEAKRKQITDAFLKECAVKTYDEASVSVVVKKLGIAKGSIYQYFDNKLDLFLYLIGECSAVKMPYVESIKREDYSDFWSYFRDLFLCGYRFDKENPLQSHFLHSLLENLNSPSIKHLFKDMMKQTVSAFEGIVENEIELGLFKNNMPIKTMGFLLYKVGVSIQEELLFEGAINPLKSIESNSPIYEGKKELLMQKVDDYIALVKPSFNKKQL